MNRVASVGSNVSRDDASCEFVFRPAEWERRAETPSMLSESELDAEGHWRCHRETIEGSERCLFHTDPAERDADPDEISDAVRTAVQEAPAGDPGRRAKQFIGASFGRLDLQNARLLSDDTHPLDLRHATVEGPIVADRANIAVPVRAGGLRCDGAVSFQKAVTERSISFQHARVGAVDLRDGTFRGRVGFNEAEIDGEVTAMDADFQGRVAFRSATVREDAQFATARFHDQVAFDTTFCGAAGFSQTSYDEQAFFSDATYHGDANFWNATFRDEAEFTDTTAAGELLFKDADFEGIVRIRRLMSAEGSPIEVDLCEATLTDGVLAAETAAEVRFDLHDATIGDVRLFENRTEASLAPFRFANTRFDGFDFKDRTIRRELVREDWQLVAAAETEAPSTLESTYLRAKNGAQEIGDDRAAGEFFIRELRYRRQEHRATAVDSDNDRDTRLLAAGAWMANATFAATAGYGERPWRTVVTSIALILGFAGLFAVTWPGQTPPYGSALGYLLFSLESFSALVLGGSVAVTDTLNRGLAQVEAFAGAFMIALFVFTLTRKVRR